MAAPQRPRLGLRDQQLFDGQGAAGVRHLYWNQDGARLAAGLHHDFVRMALGNTMASRGAMAVLGSSIDLGAVDVDVYTVAGLNDHIVPWENAYRGTRLFGGSRRFVLSTSGHIQALINPPGRTAARASVSPRSYRRPKANSCAKPRRPRAAGGRITRAGWLCVRASVNRRARRSGTRSTSRSPTERVERLAEALGATSGRRVAIIGHSRGGHVARAVAAILRVFGRSCTFIRDYTAEFPVEQVRLTSIYSKGDGVVRWERAIVAEAECIEVTGSHVGLMANRKAYPAIAAALALPELALAHSE